MKRSTGPAGNAVRNSSWNIVRRGATVLTIAALALAGGAVVAAPAGAVAIDARVNLRVLVVSNGSPSVEALATQLDREGVPYTKVVLGSAGRPQVDAAFLADAATHTARYQAVVVPNHDGGGLSDAEVAALADYERTYGIRQVSAYNWPSASVGLQPPVHAGRLDGGTVTVSAAGRAGAFAYLRGSLAIDDFAPDVSEVYGYLSQPVAPRPAGESFTPLLTATVDGATGVLAGVDARDGREELVLTAAVNPSMQWFNEVGHGIVTWMTRGIHLGHQRNYFAVHIDDVLLADSRWSVEGNCTPGDDCVDPTVTTTDIRMTAADVDRLVQWQRANGFALDMVFNGGGSDAYVAETGQPDPLGEALKVAQSQFPWINHTYSHPFMGCIQVAPTVVGQPWHCATDPAEGPRQDPEIPGAMLGGTYWASQEYLVDQISQNIAWARAAGLTDFDPAELVTGEHSGLTVQPQQPTDNPFLGPALGSTGVRYTASDASRESAPRAVGAAVTVPRHPMNVYYNAGTYRDEVDEYNWYYTTRADGGGGICEDNPAVSTCVAPLPAADDTQARDSFARYIKPMETRNALRFVLTNDPRPFYAHQSNLAEDGILYPVLESVLGQYRAVYADNAPLVRTDLTTQSLVLARQAAWTTASDTAVAYLDRTGVHVPDAAVDTPITVPAGTTVAGASLASYGGELSGWVPGQVTAVPPGVTGGYLPPPVPVAPAIGVATAGDASATLTWTAPASDGGSPLTGSVVSVFLADGQDVVRTVRVPSTATSAVVRDLIGGTAYAFTVAGTNAFGTGAQSARSNVVTPRGTGAPTIGTAMPGDRSASVTWAPPTSSSAAPLRGYTVAVYQGAGGTPVRTVSAAAGTTSLPVPGLTNGTPYSFTVSAVSSVGAGPASARSNTVVPGKAPHAPKLRQVKAGNASVAVTWTTPSNLGSGPISGYLVSVSAVAGTAPPTTLAVPGGATGATVTGLTNGVGYTLTVAAANAFGMGPASARSPRFTPQTVPGAPMDVTATARSRSATVSWSAPADDGGAAIAAYLVVGYRGDQALPSRLVTAQPSATSVSVSRLVAGASYRFVVVAVSAGGVGQVSAPASVTPTR